MMDREVNMWGRMVNGMWAARRMLQRIENGVVDGMPDTFYTIDNVQGWIELKAPLEPKRPTTALFSGNHKLSVSQRNWLLMHHQAGGISWVAVETESTWLLIEGRHADSVNSGTLDQLKELAAFWANRPMTENNWREVVQHLTKQIESHRKEDRS